MKGLTIKNEDEEDVRHAHRQQRDLDGGVRHPVLERHERREGEDGDSRHNRKHNGEHAPEALEDPRELLKDGRLLDVLLGSRPSLGRCWRGGRTVS